MGSGTHRSWSVSSRDDVRGYPHRSTPKMARASGWYAGIREKPADERAQPGTSVAEGVVALHGTTLTLLG